MDQLKKWFFAAITAVCYILFAYFFITYRKIYAEWFGINIVIFAVIIAGIVLLVAMKLEWFERNYYSSNWKMYLIVVGGFVLSLFLGIQFTENTERNRNSLEYSYADSQSGGYYYNNIAYLFDSGSSNNSGGASSIDIDDDAGEGIAYLFLIVVVILAVLGSAFIPHFWVVACAVTVVLMGLLTYREMTLKDIREKNYY